jgi:hypothetical protein
MLGTNRHFESLLRGFDGQIANLERMLIHGDGAASGAPTPEDLGRRRRAVKLLILNRRVEAAKRVVDFQKWRDGNGALFLCTSEPQSRQRAG